MNSEYRPCVVRQGKNKEERRALFHRWADYAQIREAMTIGSVSGQLSEPFGIVEYDDGTIDVRSPGYIRFTDSKVSAFFEGGEDI